MKVVVVFSIFILMGVILVSLESLAYWVVLTLKGPARKWGRLSQTIPLILLFVFWSCFGVGVWGAESNFCVAIDPIDQSYSPLSHDHVLSVIVYLCLSWWGLYSLWKGESQPPLLQVILISFVVAGMLLCLAMVGQLSTGEQGHIDDPLMIVAPFVQIFVSCWLLIKFVRKTSQWSKKYAFKNQFLNYLSEKLQQVVPRPIIMLIMLLPVYLIVSLVLIIFGQEPDSLVKAMTETTEWQYSIHTHPPFLDHQGHYLCTVAVCGTPGLVKPLRLGVRHGNAIVVNRQLLIANAFEVLIERKFPTVHRIIRYYYDRYGYPFSRHINTARRSNTIYFIMKPIELMFLVIIYLCSEQPERLINEQYRV